MTSEKMRTLFRLYVIKTSMLSDFQQFHQIIGTLKKSGTIFVAFSNPKCSLKWAFEKFAEN